MDGESVGEAQPFRTLYDGNRARVGQLLQRMVGAQDAEDLSQIVFAKAAQALPQFRGERANVELALSDRCQCRLRLVAQPRRARGEADRASAGRRRR